MESDVSISLTKPSFTISNRAMKYIYFELLNCLNLFFPLKYCLENFILSSHMTAEATVLSIIQLKGITLRITFSSISLGSLKMGKLHGE